MNYSMKTLISSDAGNEEDGKPNPDDGRDIAHYTPEGVCALPDERDAGTVCAEMRPTAGGVRTRSIRHEL